MVSEIWKGIKKFLKNFDYFGVQFYFNYKSQEKFHSATGGLSFIIFLVVAVSYAIINALPLIKREKMTIIYYTMQLSETDEINLEKYGNTAAIGFSSCGLLNNSSEFFDIFSLNINHVQFLKSNGTSKKERVSLEYEQCNYKHFNNKFNATFDTLGLDKYVCLKNANFSAQGIFSDPVFQYIEISLTSRHKTAENFKRIKEVLADECDLNFYTLDTAFDLSSYKNPVNNFLFSRFITLKYNEYMKMNNYFVLHKFDSYHNYIFDNHDTQYHMGSGGFELYSVFKGDKRFEEGGEDFDIFAKVYLRAGMQRNIIERRYMKLTEFAADVSSILSTILLIMFVVLTFVNKFYANESVMQKIFKFNSTKHKSKDQIARQNLKRLINKKGLFNEGGGEDSKSKLKYKFFRRLYVSYRKNRQLCSFKKFNSICGTKTI